jgi:hypothetical protein
MGMTAYSEDTGLSYESWDALVAAEANGWVVITIITGVGGSWPWISGPFETKREATNARVRARSKWNRERRDRPDKLTASFFVRPLWKDTR